MIAYSNLIKAQVKWSQRFIDYLKTSCQAYGTLQDRNVSASKAWIMYQSASYNWKHETDCTYIISKPIRPQIQCWQCCVVLQTISNELCTLHTYLQDMQLCWRGKNTQMVKLLVQFYSVLRITWHQPSLRVWIFPWNLRTSHKAFTPSDPIGL